jgi:putative alpha-1,2-mannosidase
LPALEHRTPVVVFCVAVGLVACADRAEFDLPQTIEVANNAPYQRVDARASDGFVDGFAALDYVDPLIGTAGVGFAYAGMTPAVQVPLGWLRVGPDTTNNGSHPALLHHFSGYYGGDPQIRGFSHTHFVGTGTADYGNLRFSFGGDAFDRGLERRPDDWWMAKSAGSEVAEPGYYQVRSEEGVVAEMTATDRAAIHRYRVPSGAWLAIDPTASVDDANVMQASITDPDDEGVMRGRILYAGDWVGRQNPIEMFFAIEVGPRPSQVHRWDEETGQDALAMRWDGDARVLVRVGVSLLSAENADGALRGARQTTFASMREDARRRWAQILDRVQIADGDEHDRTVFYTALYNCFRMPSRLDEHGVYPGLDAEQHETLHPDGA